LNYRIFILVLTSIFVVACQNKIIYESEKSLNKKGWKISDPAEFSVTIEDTLSSHNLFVEICNNEDYRFSNIFLFTKINFPNGVILNDTVEFIMADEAGKWEGRNSSGIYKNKFFFRQNIRFPIPGKYLFKFEQAMRVGSDEILHDIESIKFIIEKK